jgi:hypothetical protein
MIPIMKKTILLFVEGDTEKEFYEVLFQYYRKISKRPLRCNFRVINLKGIGKFENKVSAKIKHELRDKYKGTELVIFCCYDTDVFDLAGKPATQWSVVKKKVADLGISKFNEIAAHKMIEDWFLNDMDGLCSFLNIKNSSKPKGKDGYEKMKTLFRKGNKVYQKGSYCHRFIPMLNISLIVNKIKGQLMELEKELGVVVDK